MSIELGGVTIDCANPRKLADFWTAALGYEVGADFDGEFMALVPKGAKVGQAAYLALQRVDEPKAGKNRAHLDFHTEDRRAEVERLVALGAKVLDEQTAPGFAWTVLADPDGNEFCVGTQHE